MKKKTSHRRRSNPDAQYPGSTLSLRRKIAIAYLLADSLAKFYARADLVWFETDADNNQEWPLISNSVSARAEKILYDLGDLADSCPHVKGSCQKFKRLIEQTWRRYCTSWGNPLHRKQAGEYGDFCMMCREYSRAERRDGADYFRKVSPLAINNGRGFDNATIDFGDSLPDEIGLSFRLAWSLSCIVECLRTSDVSQRDHDGVTEFGYWKTELEQMAAGSVSRLRETVHQDFPNDFDLSDAGFDEDRARHMIVRFHESTLARMRRVARQEKGIPAYLGVILLGDGPGEVHREGHDRTVDLTSRVLPWHLLQLLIDNGSRHTTLDETREIWKKWGTEEAPTKNVMAAQISELRKLIAPLNLSISNRRHGGWRLEVCSK